MVNTIIVTRFYYMTTACYKMKNINVAPAGRKWLTLVLCAILSAMGPFTDFNPAMDKQSHAQ